jgi:hypothetical protein
MVSRGDILMLGITSGVIGSLVGGIMLGIGMDLIVGGQPLGWLLMLPGAPVAAIPGWLLARKLARQLEGSVGQGDRSQAAKDWGPGQRAR